MADYGIAVKTLDSAGGPHLAGGQDWFLVEDKEVVIFGDHVTPHAPPILPHTTPIMNQDSSSWMELDGVPVIREGHKANCLHQSTGRPWFTIPD